MRVLFLTILFALAGCPGGDGGIGETCGSHDACDSTLQCSSGVCVPRCARAPDCGDGYACDADGLCQLATGQPGDACTSESDCAPGLACSIDGAVGPNGYLLASCTAQNQGKPTGALCEVDDECRNGTCALGHCVDLCAQTRDCAESTSCMDIPHVEYTGQPFQGCLQSKGNIQWEIPNVVATPLVKLPVPSGAHSAQVVLSVDDRAQRVGLTTMTSPSGATLFLPPCPISEPGCNPEADFFKYPVRHTPLFGQSTIGLPSTPSVPIETGMYTMSVQSFRNNGLPGSAIPRITASVRIDSAVLLDLHFYFLNFDEHMCQSSFNNARFDAAAAQTETFFQDEFLGALRGIFAPGGIALGTITYEDLTEHPDLDGLDIADAGELLRLGEHASGINVFFVRTLSPVGLQAFGPNPGPAGLAKTRQSGIIIGLDTLCYRSWTLLARLTAHELARYMGLHHNVELGATSQNNLRDNIPDSDDSDRNLMFYSEFGGVEISPGQRDILTRSGVLR